MSRKTYKNVRKNGMGDGMPRGWLKQFLPVITAVLFLCAAPWIQAYEPSVDAVIMAPTVTCRKTFSMDTARDIWNRALDNPCLMAEIWASYGFQPLYTVIGTATGFHVSDSSGINGDFRQIDGSGHARTFYGRGDFDHWAIPSFFTADGVIVLAYTGDGSTLSGEAAVFMRGENGISRLVMRLFSGILTRRVGNRIDSTLENLETIMGDIANEPRKVRDRLKGEMLRDFDAVFSGASISVPER
jgi:hypothetical protein